MGAKRFGAADLQAASWAKIAEGEAGFDSTCVVHFVNRTDEVVRVDLVYVATSSPQRVKPEDHLLHKFEILAGQYHEIKAIALEEGYSLLARSHNDGVGAVAYGFKEEK